MPKSKMVPVILCLMLIFGSLPALETVKADNERLTITATSLNVRQGPGLSYPVAGSVKKGEKYSIVKQEGDWIQISLGRSKKGWVAEWFTAMESNVLPAVTQSPTGTTGSVTANGLRVRKGPGTEFQIIGSLNSGQAVEIMNSNDKWTEVRTSSIQGWVAKEFIITIKDSKETGTPANNEKAKTKGVVTADSLNVREKPSTNAKTIGSLKRGAEVSIFSQSNGWAEITYSEKKAWVSDQFLKVNQNTSSDKKQPSSPASQYSGTVTASQLYVRDSNALDGKVIGTITQGQSFQIIEEVNNWVKIEYKAGETGWAAGWFFQKTKNGPVITPNQPVKNSRVNILHDGTNIRKGASTGSSVISRANQGDSFEVISAKNDWYEISLSNGLTGFVAGWIVSIQGNSGQIEKPGAEMHTKNRTIVIDPGHGGRDNGTTGVRGTLEKSLTLKTAQLVYDKLKASGTNVIMTRNNDSYISLGSRVSTAHYQNADAFISLHFDSTNDRSVRGMTTYYYNSIQKPLGEQIHSSVISKTMLKDRGTRFGDYHVIRENRQKAILVELGYLSNPAEEMLVNTSQYQQAVANGIFDGLARYFKNNN
ncbi:SH3 domain-containing protein [Bacillus sp. JJ1609]|uniref:SH3 domain-containing protein n=1 Tax=Bacillus sp. JJ1609 TaxID=3122977 RepID=UPI002FFDB6CF